MFETVLTVLGIALLLSVEFSLRFLSKHKNKIVLGVLALLGIKKVFKPIKLKVKQKKEDPYSSQEIKRFKMSKGKVKEMVRAAFISSRYYNSGNFETQFNYNFPLSLENYLLWRFPSKEDIKDVNLKLEELLRNRSIMLECQRWLRQEITKGAKL